MKQGWEIKIFEDCIVKVRSTTKIPKKKFLNDGAYPIISQEDEFINGYWDNEDDIFTVEKPLVIFGDHTKKVKYVDFNFVMGADGIKVLQPIDDINARFFFYQIQSLTIEDLGYARHFRLLKKQYLFIPLLEEQKRIVAKLDKCFEAIDKARTNVQKNLNNAKELFQSQLNQIFSQKGDGWVEEKMVDVCSVLTCGVASTPKYVDKENGIPFLSAQNVRNGKVVLEKYKYISKEFHQHLTKKNKPQKGDILYSRVGAKFGEAGVVEHNFEFSVYVSLTLIRPIATKLNNYFFKYYLNSPLIKKLAKGSIQSSGVPNLNVKVVREFPAVYPSLSIQKEIVNKIKLIESQTQYLESNYQQELDALDELKKSILQKAFNGEL